MCRINTYAYFDTTNAYEWKEYAGFDLYDLAYRTKNTISNAAVDDACDDVMDAVSAAVIDSTLGNSGGGYLPGSHGLSIFFPYGDGAYGGYTYLGLSVLLYVTVAYRPCCMV